MAGHESLQLQKTLWNTQIPTSNHDTIASEPAVSDRNAHEHWFKKHLKRSWLHDGTEMLAQNARHDLEHFMTAIQMKM